MPVVGRASSTGLLGRASTTAKAWERAGTRQLGEFTARDHHIPQM
jgi:hypothetical protein